MSLSDRDRKILIALVPLMVAVAYWFLLMSPKREESAKATKELTEQQERLTAAQGQVSQASTAKTDFAADYTQVVRLGKAIPAAVDMPGLMVQLERAADGTGIAFTKIATGDRQGSTTPTQPPAQGGQGAPPAAAGGQPAQSAPGSAAESANNASATSDQKNQATDQASQNAGSDTQTSTSSQSGGLPVGGGAGGASGAAAGGGGAPAGLETVPLELEFEGNFFNLADFFHRVKRLVHLNNQRVVVSGRLVTIEEVKYSSDPELFPRIKAELKATIYLVPAGQGTSAGATPQGPSATTPAASGQPAPSSAPPTPPAATATPR